ncbi:Thioredoxin 1 (TRX1) (TRX) (modular protein) [Thiocapsa sp. KS1]|nr:Thioredoxin 1 (TRX1) (TRX) (modular protein) [Thiocapsa sp. KS1]
MGHVRDVQPARGHVGADQHGELAVGEVLQQLQAFLLGHVPGEHRSVDAVALEETPDAIGLAFGVDEDHDARIVPAADQAEQQGDLLLVGGHVAALAYAIGRDGLGLDLHELRVVHVLVGQLGDAIRECRREQEPLTVLRRRHAPEQEADVLDESEVEHAVGLVEHDRLDRLKIEDLLLEIVDQAPGCADEDIDAAGDLIALLLIARAAVDDGDAQTCMLGQQLRIPMDLYGKLAGRGEDQRPRARDLRRGGSGIGQQALHQDDQEGGGLAGTGLGLAGDIPTRQCDRQGLLLDRGTAGKTRFVESVDDPLIEREAVEAGLSEVFVGHAVGSPWSYAPRGLARLANSLRFGSNSILLKGTFQRQFARLLLDPFAPRPSDPAPPSSAERDIETTARAATTLWEITSVSDSIVHVTDDSFEDEVLKSLEPVLVDYWADWCGPCKMIAPVLDEIAGEYAGRIKVAKLNIDENPSTPPRYGIRGIPTLMLFRQGEVEATKVGAVSKSQLTAFIDSNL